MRLALVATALAASGCYASHGAPAVEADAGPSPFAGRWLIDQPSHALYEATLYDFEADGRVVEVCSLSLGGPVPTGTVTREDGLTCRFVGPWSSRDRSELAIETFCDDSVERTAVLTLEWDSVAPTRVEVKKVDGEEEGWSHGMFEWRWLPCGAFGDECAVCE